MSRLRRVSLLRGGDSTKSLKPTRSSDLAELRRPGLVAMCLGEGDALRFLFRNSLDGFWS